MERRGITEEVVRQIITTAEQQVRGERAPHRAALANNDGNAAEDVSCSSGHRVLEGRAVRITYDRQTDTLSVVLKEGVAVAESDEGKPGVILDYDAAGDLVSLEILEASRRVTEAGRVEYQTL